MEIVDQSQLTLSVALRQEGSVDGTGVFATKKIKKGEKICFFDGDLKDTKVRIRMSKTADNILSIINADDVFKNLSSCVDDEVNMCLAHPNPKLQVRSARNIHK